MGRFSCRKCTNRTCLLTKKPCAEVEKLLPRPRSGCDAFREVHLLSAGEGRSGRDPDSAMMYLWGAREETIAKRRAWLDHLDTRAPGRKPKDAKILKQIAEMYWWQGLNQIEIGQKLGLSRQAVHGRLTHLRRRLGLPTDRRSALQR